MRELEGTPLASFSRRAAAFFVDTLVVVGLIVAVALPPALIMDHLHPDREIHIDIRPFGDHSNWYSILAFVAYFSIAVFLTNGRTIGKRVFGLRIVSTVHDRISLWHAVERALAYGVSAAEGGLGFLQYFTASDCRTTHDRIAETIVVDTRRRRDRTATATPSN
jgi:uncharacterized RDD family membrane protein YckC